MSEDKERQEESGNIEKYQVVAAAVASGAVKTLSAEKQEAHQRLTVQQKVGLLAISTLAFLAIIGCDMTTPTIGPAGPTETPYPMATRFPTETPEPVPTMFPFPTKIPTEPTTIPRPIITPGPTITPRPPIPTTLEKSILKKQTYKDQLPSDIVTEQELEQKYNTRIWDTPDVKLHLRREALEKEPIFKYLQESGSQFDIVLLDGSKVHPEFLSEEQKKALPDLVKILNSIYKSPQQLREMYVKLRKSQENSYNREKRYNQDSLDMLKDDLSKGLISQEWFNIQKKSLDDQLPLIIAEEPTREDLANMDKERLAGGMFISGFDGIGLKSDANGRFKGLTIKKRVYVLLPVGGTPLDPSQSFPNPDDYPRFKNTQSYLINIPHLGWALRHEFAHSEKDSEAETDLLALHKLEEAYKAFLQGNDSFYYFVFETPQGNVVTKPLDKSTQKAV